MNVIFYSLFGKQKARAIIKNRRDATDYRNILTFKLITSDHEKTKTQMLLSKLLFGSFNIVRDFRVSGILKITFRFLSKCLMAISCSSVYKRTNRCVAVESGSFSMYPSDYK